MRAVTDRRRFLQGALGAATVPWALAGPVDAAGGDGLTVQPIGPEVLLIRGAGGNVVRVGSPDGAVLIDGGLAARSAALLRRVQADRRPLRALINTHWHWDHTGSNEALGKAGVPIIAHENTKLWMQRPISVPWEAREYPPVAPKALPTSTFYTADTLHLGNRELRYGYLGQAHTDGDLYVHLPDCNVLVVGDVVSVGSYPVLDYATGGWVGGVLEATKQLLSLADAQTVIIPGSGPPVTRSALEAESAMLEVLKERVWQLMRKGLSDKDIVAAKPTAEYDAQWGDPTQFLLSSYKGLWGHVREQRGVV